MEEKTTAPIALEDRPTWQLVLKLAWPVLLQMLLVFLVSLSDALLAGRFQPREGNHVAAQSALTTATYLTWLISSYTVLVTVGSTALIARFIGAGEKKQAIEVANQTVLLSLILGIPAGALGIVGSSWLLSALQLQPEAIDFAVEYLRPLFFALPLQMLMAGGIASLVGAGDTRTGMWALLLVAVVNVPFSWAFFHGWGPFPEMGFPGIGAGTAVSHSLGGLVILLVLMKGRAGLRVKRSELAPRTDLLRRMLRISIPAGADSLALMIGQLWFLSIVNQLTSIEGAAHGISLRWEGISYLAGTAFGTAAMTLVGQNLGAKRPQMAARSGWTAFAMACGVMCILGAVFYILAPQMFEVFCPHPHQRPVIEAGVPVLRLIAFAMPPLACTIVFTQALRGAGDTRVPVLLTLIGFFLVRAPLAIYLTGSEIDLGFLGTIQGRGMGLFGAWMAMVIDLVVRGLLFWWRFASNRWTRIEV